MRINKELLRGSSDILVLSLLDRKTMYGYQIIKELEMKSNGEFSFKEGTLYPILHRLEADGIIESFWSESESNRKRKYYKLTKKGKEALNKKQEEWQAFSDAVENIVKWEDIKCH